MDALGNACHQAYAFDVVPEVFENPECRVIAIAAERTFWEKATILHQEEIFATLLRSLQARGQLGPRRRAFLPEAPGRRRGFKRRFYASARARYDLAVLGSLKLLPTAASHIQELSAIC